MIQSLRKKFVGATMLSLLLVLLVILGAVNLVSYRKTLADADSILNLLSENQGTFPKQMFPGMGFARDDQQPGERPMAKRGMSPETPYESRFFWVTVDGSGTPIFTDSTLR